MRSLVSFNIMILNLMDTVTSHKQHLKICGDVFGLLKFW